MGSIIEPVTTIPPRPPEVRRTGSGDPVVFVHGLGATFDCWRLVVPSVARHREVVTFDLPGFGGAEPLPGPFTIQSVADAVEQLLAREGLLDADLVGSSLGAEIVFELLRRGHGRNVVAIAPSGYWNTPERLWFMVVAWFATALVTLLRPVVPAIIGSKAGRLLFLYPLSPRPARLPEVSRDATHLFGCTPSFVPALRWLVRRRLPVTVPASRTAGRRVTVAWGRRDALCLPAQAFRVLAAVPGATLHWFACSGHLPPWDEPEETARLVLDATR